ncbi:hypothetical protein MNBD_GAMMA13-637 [hydrothermal vent metagenome]|uniref:Uncharacterized protein n=1 Tax=hydrothermal vent metagenome TaxID=652676 RepID=A0A3B0Y815_9ZZZZ
MTSDSVKLDDEGVPMLQNPVSLETLQTSNAESTPMPDLTDHEVVAKLLQYSEVQDLLDDISEDLQNLVSWKIESLLKEQIGRLIKEATEESAFKMAGDIRTQLQLALPDLLANLIKQAKEPDSTD